MNSLLETDEGLERAFADGRPSHKALGFLSGLEVMQRRVPNLRNASEIGPNANSPVP
jgi:hypothetical protein